MGCREGADPADFLPGFGDDADDPIGAQLLVLNAAAEIVDAQGHVYVNFTVGVNNINFDADVSFNWDTADHTAISTGGSRKYRGIAGQSATIPAGESSVIIPIPVYVSPPAGGAMYTGIYDFYLNISSPTNATILDSQGIGTINYGLLTDGTNPSDTAGLSLLINGSGAAPQGMTGFFFVMLNPAAAGAVTVHYASVDDTAHAGTDFTGLSGTLTFLAGETDKNVAFHLLNSGAAVERQFSVTLSSPVGASIVPDATSITIRIAAASGSGDLPAQYTGWSDNLRVTYDEFHPAGGGGCVYKSAGTGFAGAAVMSALAAKKGLGRWRFNAPKLYEDAGCPLCQSGGNCNAAACAGGCNPTRVPNWLASTGAQRVDKNVRNNGSNSNYTCTYRDVTGDHAMFKADSAAIGASSKTSLINQIKNAVHDNGAIYMASIFYDNWNQCRSSDNYILQPSLTDIGGNAAAEAVVAQAQTWLGNCYNLGGEQRCQLPIINGTHATKGLDCSGLMYNIFTDAGYGSLIGNARKLANGYYNYYAGLGQVTTNLGSAVRGDMIVYQHSGGGGQMKHIGLYVGGGKVISALINPWGVTKSGVTLSGVSYYGVLLVHYPGTVLRTGTDPGNGSGDGSGDDPPGDPTDPEYTLDMGTSDKTHAWAIVGWDDAYRVPDVPSVWGPLAGQSVGCFRVQSSHGCGWGDQGRGYIPYSYLTLPTEFVDDSPRYKYWKLTWVG